jgi:hypothetical protein
MPNPNAPTTADTRRVPFLTDRGNSGAVGFQKGANPSTLGTHTTPSLAAVVVEDVLVSNGAYEQAREADTFKSFDLTAVTTEQTIWDPASGKKFRLLGIHILASATSEVELIDGTGGATIFRIGAVINVPITIPLGRVGILSGAADRNLMVKAGTSTNLFGTVYGVEEA